MSKRTHPFLWICLDRVLSSIILLENIPRKENSAADFLSRVQTDPNLTLQIKFTDQRPIREIGKETEAKAPIVFLSKIGGYTSFSGDIHPVVDEQFMHQLKAHGFYNPFLTKQYSGNSNINITHFLTLLQFRKDN